MHCPGCCVASRAISYTTPSMLIALLISYAKTVNPTSALTFLRHVFIRLELYMLIAGISWYESKTTIMRDAARSYLAHSIYILGSTA